MSSPDRSWQLCSPLRFRPILKIQTEVCSQSTLLASEINSRKHKIFDRVKSILHYIVKLGSSVVLLSNFIFISTLLFRLDTLVLGIVLCSSSALSSVQINFYVWSTTFNCLISGHALKIISVCPVQTVVL